MGNVGDDVAEEELTVLNVLFAVPGVALPELINALVWHQTQMRIAVIEIEKSEIAGDDLYRSLMRQ